MVGVSIVTYHTDLEELEQAIRSLSSPLVSKVYIVDNGEEERIRQWCQQHNNVVYLPAPNPGYGAAHNIAIRRSVSVRAKYHLVLNSDLRFDPSVIAKIYDYMESHQDVGTLQPKIVNPDGSLQYTCRRLPTPLDVFARRFLPSFINKSRDDRYLLKYLDPQQPHNIPYHQGSFMFLRTEALEDVGLFDERFFMYPEDIDLTRRIHARWITLYYPEAEVVHFHRAASYHNLRMTKIHALNMVRYFNKWGWWMDLERRRFNRSIR